MINKQTTIRDYAQHDTDTGSAQVQIAMLTEDIRRLTEHFKKFPKDANSKRGLMVMVGKRTALLRYLKRTDEVGYSELVKRLQLR